MNSPEYSGSEPQKLPAQIGNVAEVKLEDFGGEPRVRDVDLAERLGFSRGRDIRPLIDKHRIALEGFGAVERRANTVTSGKGRRQDVDEIWLNEPQSLYVGAKSDAPNAPAVLTMLINVFVAWRKGHLVAMPNFSDPVAAARAWANEYEARRIAERTKAEIGSRREATAMATASNATRRVQRLEIALDRAASFASVKRMEKHYTGRTFNWRLLKEKALALGFVPIKAPDANYGEVNTYHADVWREVYGLEIPKGEA